MFRTVCVVQIGDFVRVLHAFQKKAKSGIATPKPDVELIEKRLKAVRARHGPGEADETSRTEKPGRRKQ